LPWRAAAALNVPAGTGACEKCAARTTSGSHGGFPRGAEGGVARVGTTEPSLTTGAAPSDNQFWGAESRRAAGYPWEGA
jgi:hypothetical protein